VQNAESHDPADTADGKVPQACKYKLAGIGSATFTFLAGKLYQGVDALVNV